VTSAKNPREVLKKAGELEDMDMLVTDVVMPGINGNKLGQELKARNPRLKVLYISGYTNTIATLKGVLKEGVHYLQKPFTPLELAKKVRAIFDTEKKEN